MLNSCFELHRPMALYICVCVCVCVCDRYSLSVSDKKIMFRNKITTVFFKTCLQVFLLFLWLSEIDRAFKQFVFESMDLATTDPNGFLLTREAEGLEHSSIPWDDPYPFFKGMIPHEEKVSKVDLVETPSEERSGWWSCVLFFLFLFSLPLFFDTEW